MTNLQTHIFGAKINNSIGNCSLCKYPLIILEILIIIQLLALVLPVEIDREKKIVIILRI